MTVNACRRCACDLTNSGPGRGTIADPNRPWWAFWRMVECPACGGDGMAKPPGWPDPAEIERLRPKYVAPSGKSAVKPQTPWPAPPAAGEDPGEFVAATFQCALARKHQTEERVRAFIENELYVFEVTTRLRVHHVHLDLVQVDRVAQPPVTLVAKVSLDVNF